MINRFNSNLALLMTVAASGVLLQGSANAQAIGVPGGSDRPGAMTAPANSRHSRSSWIARCRGPLTPAHLAQLKSLGADIYRRLPIIHSVALSVPARNVARLAALPFVAHLSEDCGVTKCDEFLVESSGAAVAAAQYSVDGTGIGVAVIDSGVHANRDMLPKLDGPIRLLTGANFVPPGNSSNGKARVTDTDDPCGHGSHVAGIVAGNGFASSTFNCFRTFFGVARNATIVPVRVLDANGDGTVSQVVAGIQWVVSHRATGNIRVINLSLGHPVGESYTTDPLCQAAEAAWKAGIVVVCSAGNSGRLQNMADPMLDNEGYGSAYGSIQSPGNDPYVITVGAMKATDLVFAADGMHTHNRSADRIATYSSRGPSRLDLVLKPDIVAPGNHIISTDAGSGSSLGTAAGATNEIPVALYKKGASPTDSTNYFRLSGTSMAAPVVAGAVALMLQKTPTLSPDAIKARLMLSADKWKQPDGTADPLTFGAGYLNILGAMSSTATPNQPAMSPTLSITSDGGVQVNPDRALWGHALDGSSAIWGVSGINDLRAIWGHDALSATSSNLLTASRSILSNSVYLERAIWGHSVWEDRAIWGHTAEAVDLSSTVINGE